MMETSLGCASDVSARFMINILTPKGGRRITLSVAKRSGNAHYCGIVIKNDKGDTEWLSSPGNPAQQMEVREEASTEEDTLTIYNCECHKEQVLKTWRDAASIIEELLNTNEVLLDIDGLVKRAGVPTKALIA